MAALPPLNALRAFEAAARRGSFAAASEELNVTPAAIGQQVRQLEALIGAPLFERGGGGLKLTERGAAGLDRLSRAFELVGQASSAMREASTRAELVVSAPSDFAGAWLAPRLAGRIGEGLRLTLIEDGADPFEAGADIAIVFAAEPPAGYESHLILREVLAPLAPPQIVSEITVSSDLERYRLVEEHSALPGWRAWLAARGAYGIDPAPAVRTRDGLSALAFAESGAGIVLARRSLAGRALTSGTLAPVFADGDWPVEAGFYALTRRGRRLSPAAGETLAFLRAQGAGFFDAADEL